MTTLAAPGGNVEMVALAPLIVYPNERPLESVQTPPVPTQVLVVAPTDVVKRPITKIEAAMTAVNRRG